MNGGDMSKFDPRDNAGFEAWIRCVLRGIGFGGFERLIL